jgi:hypothetical protein
MENGKKLIHSFNSTDYSQGHFEGLTKREYFAGLAMQAIVSNTSLLVDKDMVVRNAIYYADELLKQLSND